LDHAQKGDVVLCLGKGHEDYMILDDQHTIHFSEREVIEEYKLNK
jgi:UDP-N-acetylmuramoyl-L-alanyl-D-glutamate--2,6-diaminopimelate ligase